MVLVDHIACNDFLYGIKAVRQSVAYSTLLLGMWFAVCLRLAALWTLRLPGLWTAGFICVPAQA